ncbi:MAG: FAD-binding oxidoreductase [Actinomycetota bacterium]
MAARTTADLVIVGAGAIGGWASWFAAHDHGARRVIVLEQGVAGQGASSRAAGMVRAQGGSPDTVRLGMWSIGFYRRQQRLLGTDSGFSEQGYLILARTAADERTARARVEMQRKVGLDVRWIDKNEVRRLNPTLAAGFRGATYCPTDGWVDPPRNVRAYSLAMQQAGIDLRERTSFTGVRISRGRVTGVRTSRGVIATERVILTGGPTLREVGRLVGARFLVGAARHQVVVTEPHPDFQVPDRPMAFDLRSGIYWRPEDGGLMWGMSNPNEAPGPARGVDWDYLHLMEKQLNRVVPLTKKLGIRKAWAATIEYTPDHLPLLGPVVLRDGSELGGATVATANGHGMMWGPAIARIAADLSLAGQTRVVKHADHFRMDRFDEHGRSPFVDPVALPFPIAVDDD